MSETPEDDAKHSARLNIMQALGNARTCSPTWPSSSQDPELDSQTQEARVLPPLSPKPRSPRVSPTNGTPVHVSAVPSPSKPQRPPPPRLTPRVVKVPSAESSDSATASSDAGQRPKPPIRARKKKFYTSDDTKPVSRQSEFVELSTSDVALEGGTVGDGGPVPAIAEEQEVAVDKEVEEEKEKEECDNEDSKDDGDSSKRTLGEVNLDKEWEVIPDSAASDGSCKVIDEPCLQPNGDVSKIETAIKSLTVKKKRPPPFRPPPYNPARTPPLPPKKKKNVSIQDISEPVKWNQLAEEASSVVGSQDSTDNIETHEEESSNHIYESVDQSDTGKVETSVHLQSRPEHVFPKCTSFSSVESDQSEGRTAGIGRAGTMSEGALLRRESNRINTRPKSEIPMGRELEASFEVIPQTGSDLDTVMSSLRLADEKYQDASIYDLIQACSKALPHITSTSELPNRLPDFPDTSRALVIHELYTTEYTYVKGLEVLCEVFRDSLCALIGEETNHVFANVDE